MVLSIETMIVATFQCYIPVKILAHSCASHRGAAFKKVMTLLKDLLPGKKPVDEIMYSCCKNIDQLLAQP